MTGIKSIKIPQDVFLQTSRNIRTVGLHGGMLRPATGMTNELGTSPNYVKVLPNSKVNYLTEEKISIKVALINFIQLQYGSQAIKHF